MNSGTTESDKKGKIFHGINHRIHLDATLLFTVYRITTHTFQNSTKKADGS